MKDTPDVLESKYRDMLLKRSGAERLQDGLLHACNGTGFGSSRGAGSRPIGIALLVKKSSLSVSTDRISIPQRVKGFFGRCKRREMTLQAEFSPRDTSEEKGTRTFS